MAALTSTQELVRAKIEVIAADNNKLPSGKKNLVVHCFFNPQTIVTDYRVKYNVTPISGITGKQGPLDPKIDYQGPKGKIISTALLFDSTLEREANGQTLARGADVKTECIDKLFLMMEPLVQDSDTAPLRPPRCNFIWGDITKYMRKGIEPFYLTGVQVVYQHFNNQGQVLRATAKVTLQRAFAVNTKGQNPTTVSEPRKIWRVEAGQTLQWIAYQAYGDPTYWRYIAKMNDLADPRRLQPGQILRLPTLRS